ncbi:glycosyltransferase [Mesorhizobium sp. RP14(2022)]|uniref:Glycosyltransferase n=1 Tax=Mesorhizobium liriopis TaxID=2953882 RepID=A0ABT1C249_9HYPH|nr:glycosyltransferase [Mesorhizobium liriopis]MCO6048320.1 glycosyltransferase [Mesorhizobium liriopis]
MDVLERDRETDPPLMADAETFSAAEASVSTHRMAELVFPAITDWCPILDRLKLSFEERLELAATADIDRRTLAQQLVASGRISEVALTRLMAEQLGLSFQETIRADHLMVTDEDCFSHLGANSRFALMKQEGSNSRNALLLALNRMSPREAAGHLAAKPELRHWLRIVAPSTLRRALIERAEPMLLREAVLGLFERNPDHSARQTLNPWQGVAVGVLLTLLPFAFLLVPAASLLVTHLLSSLFFLACVALRLAAIRAAPAYRVTPVAHRIHEELPVYSVLVALYRERAVVPQLIEALQKLEWPAGRLEVKLICEADDHDTIEAIREAGPPPNFEIVAVPPALPRTKPKALNYALPLTSGEFVVLFDAEDRPDPLQLKEALDRFRRAGPDLACLQAPLVISNANALPVAGLFGLEYAALFRSLLPYLAKKRSFLPLGGTSNHFRRTALEEAGAWDPFNVTEDADLGLRLLRMGYRTETLTHPTLEDAPEDLRTWLPQRTRWFKGWLQTLFVHMRHPARLLREIGVGPFLITQVLLLGMVASALVHPLLIGTFAVLIWRLISGVPFDTFYAAILLLDITNIVCGYLSFLALGWRSMSKRERRGFPRLVLLTPLYWMLLSVAAWNAVWQLWKRPHHWSKTAHKPVRSVV